MKISILLPYKENFSPIYPGAVSLFVKDTTITKLTLHCQKLILSSLHFRYEFLRFYEF